jgi:hypothetical protein
MHLRPSAHGNTQTAALPIQLLPLTLIETQRSLLMSSQNTGHTDKTFLRFHPSIGREQGGYLFVTGLN